MINPKEDGKTHINVYSKGKTSLGRALTLMNNNKIFTRHGEFVSFEAYYHFLKFYFAYQLDCSTSKFEDPPYFVIRDILMYEKCQNAKERSYYLKKNGLWKDMDFSKYSRLPEFRERIYAAQLYRLKTNKWYKENFLLNDLPFLHYYIYSGKVVLATNHQWVAEQLNYIRENKELLKNV